MAAKPESAVTVLLSYDQENGQRLSTPRQTTLTVTPELAQALGRAAAMNPNDVTPVKFSSLLAGLLTGTNPVSRWLRADLESQAVPLSKIATKLAYHENVVAQGLLASNEPLATSSSARQAIEEGQAIAAAIDDDSPLDVHHVAAAYPVLPGWHLSDFQAYGIDRLAWCRRLGVWLAETFQSEKWYWRRFADRGSIVPLTSFSADVYTEKDLLGIDRSVDALALLMASTRTDTPLSIGVFGPWGSGKSFFMRHLRKRIWGLADRETTRLASWVAKRGNGTATMEDAPLYFGRIAQVEFNAWHYNESNLVASLVEHIFRNLSVKPRATDAELEEQRAAILVKVSGALGDVDDTTEALDHANKAVASAQEEVQRTHGEVRAVRDEVEKSAKELDAVTQRADGARKDLDAAIEALTTPGNAVDLTGFVEVALRPLAESPVVPQAKEAARIVEETITGWSVFCRRLFTPRGLAVIALLALAPLVAWLASWLDGVWAALAGTATGLLASMRHVNTFLAERRKEFEAKLAGLEKAETAQRENRKAELEAEHAKLQTGIDAQLAAAHEALAAQRAALTARESDVDAAVRALADRTKALDDKVLERSNAEAKLRDLQAQLKRLSSAILLEEFIKERSGSDEYRKQLGILALVRRDFERLSSLITSANEEWIDPAKQTAAPQLNRIVLYIDDLDRCKVKTVVEVLEAVHLLLAFPLFVCVVAVDPLWVEKCLRDRHANSFIDESKPETVQMPVRATVGDYLEKIFQIPIWMSPIDSRSRASLVKSLLGTSAAPPPKQVGGGFISEEATRPEHAPVTVVDNFEAERTRRESNPDPLQITRDEAVYIDRIAELLSDKPRALKRFVNTYRLLKASLSEFDRSSFVSDGESSAYKMCLSQLALFTGQPRLAPVLVQQLERTPAAQTTLKKWIDGLAAAAVPADVKARLSAAIDHIPDSERVSLETFKSWIPDTSKYLFHRN